MAPQLLSDEAVADRLEGLEWTREGDEIVKTVTRKDFAAALAFVNEVGALAEARQHHPDIAISWNKVTLRLSTHSAGGLTDFDMDLAGAIDALGLGGPGRAHGSAPPAAMEGVRAFRSLIIPHRASLGCHSACSPCTRTPMTRPPRGPGQWPGTTTRVCTPSW